MNIQLGRLVLLDTSVVVHLARQDFTGREIEKRFNLTGRAERPLISTITEGELLGLAKYWKWGKAKIGIPNAIMDELVRVEASHREIIEIYAELYAEGRSNGLPCGENDLWIAATAKAANAVLLTCDDHFDWLHSRHITRIYIPEAPKQSESAPQNEG